MAGSFTRRFVAPRVSSALTSATLREVRRRVAETRRRLRREPHRVHYFHQVDDPYSHLAAQALPRFLSSYAVALEPHLVGPPSDAAAPERERLTAYSRKDAADIAPFYGAQFTDSGRQPTEDASRLATSVLAAAAAHPGRFAEIAAAVGTALWSSDIAALDRIAAKHAPLDAPATAAAIAEGGRLRERLGHYLGATLYYGGEWYWGIDRLHYLEERLIALGARRDGGREPLVVPHFENAVAKPPAHSSTGGRGSSRADSGSRAQQELRPPAHPSATEGTVVGGGRLQLEFFLSLRSPYTYVSMARVFALPQRYPVEVVLRPVLPMVMRGLPLPAAKRMYIVLDTKREAESAGVRFGRIADPVGRPVERGFSLYPWARSQGKAAEYLLSFAQAAFADGIDTGSEEGLRAVVERVGLSWDQARPHLDGGGWRDELEANRQAMFDMGLWGVPSFRVLGGGAPDFFTWGQDRLWLVENEIHRRVGTAEVPQMNADERR